MDEAPLILVVGCDALTERVRAELSSTSGHEVRAVWPVSIDSEDALLAAGVKQAASILTLATDDGLNLAVALRARMLNPSIRVVMRQSDPLLGEMIEHNLANSSALSSAAHSAATYAGAALDPGCFFALRFPAADGQLLGFTQWKAQSLGIAGLTVRDAEERLRLRLLATGDHVDPPESAVIGKDDSVVAFGPIVKRTSPRRPSARGARSSANTWNLRNTLGWPVAAWHHANPVMRLLMVCAIIFFSFSFIFFHFGLHKTWTAATFNVVETMTNVGFGETAVTRAPVLTLGAIVAMLGGIVFTSIFIGYVSSALTRAQWISLQGLRRIHARNHIVLCGGGTIGRAVIDLLTVAGNRIVVVEPQPHAGLVARARERDVDLLTGSAHDDGALDLCDVPNASAVLALTDDDTTNLEIALSVRARSADVPLVVRVESASFAEAAAAIFGVATFSPGALTAPALAGLSRFPGTRGRVRFAKDDHTIGQRPQGATPQKPPAEICTPLCVWRKGLMVQIRQFAQMEPYDDLLFIVPLSQFRR